MGAGPVQFLHFLILGDGYMIFKEEFQNPPVEYRIKPFWFWNGDITKEEISHQIKEMADKGLGFVYLCQTGNDDSISFEGMVRNGRVCVRRSEKIWSRSMVI